MITVDPSYTARIHELAASGTPIVEPHKPLSRKKAHFSEESIEACLQILKSGAPEDLFEIIPRLAVLRDPRFQEPLVGLLFDDEMRKREFAAYAMGAIGDHDSLELLKRAFTETEETKRPGAKRFLVAIAEAIGSIGDDGAVEFFLPILAAPFPSGKSGRKVRRRIVESLGAIAQQGGERCVAALLKLTDHHDAQICAAALAELSVAYWHRPNEIGESVLRKIYQLTSDPRPAISESALSALQSLADVGCRRAEVLLTAPLD